MTPPPRKRPRRVRRSSSPRPFALSSTRSSAASRVERIAIHASATSASATGSSRRSPSSEKLPHVCLAIDRLELARWRLAPRERLDIPGQARQVAPTLTGHRRHGADPEPEIVAPAPVAEVVVCTEVASARARAVEAEVRRLVPAVARGRERVDDLLEVALHRVGLARELVPVGEVKRVPGFASSS